MQSVDEDLLDEALSDSVELVSLQVQGLLLKRVFRVTHIEELTPPQRATFLGQFNALWRKMLHTANIDLCNELFDIPHTSNIRVLRDEMYMLPEQTVRAA